MKHVVRVVRGAVLSVVALLVLGCGSSSADDVMVRIDNLTDTPVGVYIGGEWRGTDEPGATITTGLGDGTPPIRIEVQSPSGAVLAAFDAQAGPVEALRDGSGPATGTEVGVPCGVIRIVVGELASGEALAPAEAVPSGACP